MGEDFSGFSKKSHLNDEDYFLSEEGYIVFTEKYHLKRGYCCKSGCKHCPYGFDPKTGLIAEYPKN
jgi:hypothetical protein